jgi:uncharacterized membrane protein
VKLVAKKIPMSHSLYLFSVFLHILAAALWIGGMVFLIAVLIPAVKKHPDKIALLNTIALKFRTAGWIALILLLGTGIIQLEFRGVEWSLDYFTSSEFGKLAGIKIIVFSIIILLSFYHDFFLGTKAMEEWKKNPDDPKTISLRNTSRFLGRINFLLALLAAALGVLLVRGL